MTRSALLILVLSLVATLGAASARAQDEVTQARAHFQLGVSLIDQGRWQEAVHELEAAERIHPTAPVLYNLGIAQRGVGHARAAITAFRAFLDALGDEAPPARVEEVNGYIAELTGELAELRLALTPAGARVLVDDVVETLSPDGSLLLDPGAHHVRIEADGFEPAFRDVTLERAGHASLDVALEQVVTDGRLVVESRTPGAIVTIDGAVMGGTPYDERLPAGTHRLLVRAPGHSDLSRDIALEVGADVRVEADLVAQDDILASPWLWIGVGGAVVVGVTFGALAAAGVFTSTEQPFVGDLGVVTGALVVRP